MEQKDYSDWFKAIQAYMKDRGLGGSIIIQYADDAKAWHWMPGEMDTTMIHVFYQSHQSAQVWTYQNIDLAATPIDVIRIGKPIPVEEPPPKEETATEHAADIAWLDAELDRIERKTFFEMLELKEDVEEDGHAKDS